MQNFINNNESPELSYHLKMQDPLQNESFNKVTHPADKPVIGKHIFAIDSRQRNYDLFPDANSYSITVPETYRNVTSIELKAAMLPRSEYNVNTSNKYMTFAIGDYISDIKLDKKYRQILDNGKNIDPGMYPLKIDAPQSGTTAEIHVKIRAGSVIENFYIINAGSGYSNKSLPRITLFDATFTATIGKHYMNEFREGQYVIGGNPEFTQKTKGITQQSWVPSNLINEIESSMSNIILQDSDYCYSRKAWTNTGDSNDPTQCKTDYPLLLSARVMSQYPTIQTYAKDYKRTNSKDYQTNACKFNRIYIANSLILTVDSDVPEAVLAGNATFKDADEFEYTVLKYDTFPVNEKNNYVLYCKLENPLAQVNGKFWSGMMNGTMTSGLTTFSGETTRWELLFSHGDNKIVSSATLLGFKKRNYTKPVMIDPIQITNENTLVTVLPKGPAFSSETDYHLHTDPEYIVLSFRPKVGGGGVIAGINSRVDSQPESNINRVFACLIYENIASTALQDVSYGKNITTVNSFANNDLSNAYILSDSEFKDVEQLCGNTGSTNSSYFRPPGQTRALKGVDFDQKIVQFPQPVAQISNISIRFTKFAQNYSMRNDIELYDFHGKEHLLLFEITCDDFKTGRYT